MADNVQSQIPTDAAAPAAATPTPSQPSAPAQPQATPSAPAQASSQPAASQAPGSTSQAPASGAAGSSFLDGLRSQGFDLGNDESQARERLIGILRDAQGLSQLAPYARQYAQHADEFQRYLQSRQAEESRRQEEAKKSQWYSKWWSPPEYDPQWERHLFRDEQTGELKVRPGANPAILQKYNDYQQFRASQAEKLMQNPYAFFEEPIKHLAEQVAQEQIRRHFSQYQDSVQAREFVGQHASWLYELDANGQPRYYSDPMTGRAQPVLSFWGQRFRDHVQQEAERQARYGYSNVDEQKNNALTRVQLEYMTWQNQQSQQHQAAGGQPANQAAPAPTGREAANQAFLQAQQVPTGASPGGGRPNVNPAEGKMSLRDELRKNLLAAGIKDPDIAEPSRQG